MAQALGGLVTGSAVFARIYLATTAGGNPTPWKILARSIRVQEQATMVSDGVCGELRNRLMKVTNEYNVDVECFDDGSSSSLLTNWVLVQQNDDDYNPQLPMSGGLVFRYLDGSAGAFTFNGCSMGPLDYNIAGRTDRAMGHVTFRCQYFNKTGTAIAPSA